MVGVGEHVITWEEEPRANDVENTVVCQTDRSRQHQTLLHHSWLTVQTAGY
jgi:hypothetical protein